MCMIIIHNRVCYGYGACTCLWNSRDYFRSTLGRPAILTDVCVCPKSFLSVGLGLNGKTGSHNIQTLCQIAMPLVGAMGTAYLVHPQMLHTSSQNMKRVPRFMRNLQIPLKEPRAFAPSALSPVERCILHNFGGSLDEFHRVFRPPLPQLRRACDHDDGSLLTWKYGERPSYKGQAPPDPGHVLEASDEALTLTPNPKL
mgnify:CR=1 FL=1